MATRVLVTGGAGFIGSHVVDSLLGDSGKRYEVLVVDNFDPFYDRAVKEKISPGIGDRTAGHSSRPTSATPHGSIGFSPNGGPSSSSIWRRKPACGRPCGIRGNTSTSTSSAR